jgi:hypothetical protein
MELLTSRLASAGRIRQSTNTTGHLRLPWAPAFIPAHTPHARHPWPRAWPIALQMVPEINNVRHLVLQPVKIEN